MSCPPCEILPDRMPGQRHKESKRGKNGMLFGFAGIAPISTCDESKKPAQNEKIPRQNTLLSMQRNHRA